MCMSVDELQRERHQSTHAQFKLQQHATDESFANLWPVERIGIKPFDPDRN